MAGRCFLCSHKSALLEEARQLVDFRIARHAPLSSFAVGKSLGQLDSTMTWFMSLSYSGLSFMADVQRMSKTADYLIAEHCFRMAWPISLDHYKIP